MTTTKDKFRRKIERLIDDLWFQVPKPDIRMTIRNSLIISYQQHRSLILIQSLRFRQLMRSDDAEILLSGDTDMEDRGIKK